MRSKTSVSREIVFFSARDGHPNNQIYVMDTDGSRQTRVTFDTAF
jgi:Tol biopolymer transport system component